LLQGLRHRRFAGEGQRTRTNSRQEKAEKVSDEKKEMRWIDGKDRKTGKKR
jgi:ribosomal protein S13